MAAVAGGMISGAVVLFGMRPHPLAAAPKVLGADGVRVLRRRARAFSGGISPWLKVLGAMAAMIVWGGGMKYKVRVHPRRGEAESPMGPLLAVPVKCPACAGTWRTRRAEAREGLFDPGSGGET